MTPQPTNHFPPKSQKGPCSCLYLTFPMFSPIGQIPKPSNPDYLSFSPHRVLL